MIFIYELLDFIDWLLSVYTWIIIIATINSWINPKPNNPIVRFLHTATEPLFWRIKQRISTNIGGLDITSILVLFSIIFVQKVIIPSLISILAY